MKKTTAKSSSHAAPLALPVWRVVEAFPGGSPWGAAYAAFLAALRREEGVTEAYLTLWRETLARAEFASHPKVGNALQDQMLEAFLDDANSLHRKAEWVEMGSIGRALFDAYAQDLAAFRRLLTLDAHALACAAAKDPGLPGFKDVHGLRVPAKVSEWEEERRELKAALLKKDVDAPRLAEKACRYLRRNGHGMYARARAFRWRVGTAGEAGRLEPVLGIDPIRLSDLKGYDEARREFIANIEGFTSGHSANHVLIYGERGTGKSSTVKAALNEYATKGLRLVELSPLDALDLPSVVEILRPRPERFILFLDDLSFNDDDVRYRGLKALLEGSIEPLPANVILVATSNRRHLMPETFAEREGGIRVDGEVHEMDAVEEKLSLSDRFGLVVSFYSPDQATYLQIVRYLADKAGLRVPPAELEQGALLWTLQNNGRSGRSAAQYVRHLAQSKG